MDNQSRNMPERDSDNAQLVVMTSELVSAYVSNNPVSTTDLIRMIEDVHSTLKNVSEPDDVPASPCRRPDPAVPIEQSVTQDHIICLEDGRKFKSLKRHIEKNYNLTPDEYRQRWELPPDYPMVAPSYSAQRSMLAKKFKLGKRID